MVELEQSSETLADRDQEFGDPIRQTGGHANLFVYVGITNTYATTTDQEFGDLISEDGEQLYHQYDAQACTNALLDPSGNVQATFKYYAFGQLASSSIDGDAWASLSVDQWAALTVDQWAALPLDIGSAMAAMGQKQYYLDQETQLYLLGSGTNGRYYDANTARFVSEDPIRQAGGDTNLFAYVENNPVNKLDPGGHDSSNDDRRKKQQQATTQPSNGTPQPTPDKQPSGAGQAQTAQPAGGPAPQSGKPSDPATSSKPGSQTSGGGSSSSATDGETPEGAPGEPQKDQQGSPKPQTQPPAPAMVAKPQKDQAKKDANGNSIQPAASTDPKTTAGAFPIGSIEATGSEGDHPLQSQKVISTSTDSKTGNVTVKSVEGDVTQSGFQPQYEYDPITDPKTGKVTGYQVYETVHTEIKSGPGDTTGVYLHDQTSQELVTTIGVPNSGNSSPEKNPDMYQQAVAAQIQEDQQRAENLKQLGQNIANVGSAIGDAVASILPGVGVAKAAYEALTGKSATQANTSVSGGNRAIDIAVVAVVVVGTVAKVLDDISKELASAAESAETELHHLLPQSQKLKPFFERAGLNIEDYKIPLDKATHRLLPDGIHTGPSAESWNGVWTKFFQENPNAGKDQILNQLAKMRKDFGI